MSVSSDHPVIDRAKRWIPMPLRRWLRPRRRLRGAYYDRYFRGGVIRRGGIAYRIPPHDLIGRLVYVGGHPAREELELLQRAAPHFASFIDVGANIGTVTIPIARSFRGPVLAVEPTRQNFDALCDNLRMNGLLGHVAAQRVALGSARGTTMMHLSPDNSGDHRAGPGAAGESRAVEEVELWTLEECVEADRRLIPPFLLKIDVQGFEGEVIHGAQALLRDTACLALLEFWPFGLRANGWTPSDLFALLTVTGLRVYLMTEATALQPLGCASELEALADRLPETGYTTLAATNRSLDDVGLSDLVRAV